MCPRRADRPARTGVVMVNHDSADDTDACISALEDSLDLDLDLVVVDNSDTAAGRDEARAAIAGRAAYLSAGANLGFAGGSNLGIRRCLERGNEYVWLLNPDTRVEPSTLSTLHAHLHAVPDCGVVGPRILHPPSDAHGETVWFDGGMVARSKFGETRHIHQGRPLTEAPAPRARDVDYVTGAALLARREVFETVGLLPEDYFLYFEETHWCHDVRRAGWRVMVDQRARMLHLQRSSGALPSPYHLYYMTRNRYLFAERALGLDGEAALAHLRGKWLKNWRGKVEVLAPEWLAEFDALVELATADARAGRDGRNETVSHVPHADEFRHTRPSTEDETGTHDSLDGTSAATVDGEAGDVEEAEGR